MTITEERVSDLQGVLPGTALRVSNDDGWSATGLYVGIAQDDDGPRIRLFGDDRIERQVPLPARVDVA